MSYFPPPSAAAGQAQANAEAYTDAQLAALVGGAPNLLDTLKEIADAIGDDPAFATKVVYTGGNARQTIKSGLNVGYGPATHSVLRADDGAAAGNPVNSGPNVATSIAGAIINQNWQYRPALAAGATQSMVYLNIGNTDPVRADSNLYGIQIDTQTDRIDNGAGIAITNTGSADNIYLSVAGKAGAPAGDNLPTGIGCDVNRQPGANVENSTNNGGFGAQFWDYSSTDQGRTGPIMVKILKQNNPDTQHVGLLLRGNRKMLRIEEPRGGGFDGTQTIFGITDGDTKQNLEGNAYFSITANGTTTIQPRADVMGLLIKSNDPAGAQTAALLAFQDSNAALQAQITSGGNVWANRFRTLGSELQIDVQASGACIRMTKATAAAGNPGAGQGRLYFRDGTNAGTLKLVVRAGAAGAETTILDNIPQ